MKQEYNNIVLKTEVQLKRNFKDFLFTNKMSEEDAEQIVKGLYRIFEGEFDFQKVKSIKEQQRFSYLENDILTDDLLNNLDISFTAQNKDVSLFINGDEHITIKAQSNDFDALKLYNKAKEIDNVISSTIPISYDKNLGYLTSNYNYFGCGIVIKFTLFLPALTMSNKIINLCEKLKVKGIILKPKFTDKLPLYEIFNSSCNSISENDLINNITNQINEIVEIELKEQVLLKEVSAIEIKDKIFRALGICKYCYQISKEEAIKCLCCLKFGEMLDIVTNKNIDNKNTDLLENSIKILNDLRYNINDFNLLDLIAKLGDGNLQLFYDKIMNNMEINIKRAEFLNNYFNKKLKGDKYEY